MGNIFEEMTSIEVIELACEGASRDKGQREEIKDFYKNFDNNVLLIQKLLREKLYRTSEYRFFKRNDRGKIRELCDLPFFPDRIIHWVVIQGIEEMFIKHFISSTYAAISGRGPVLALDRLNRDIRRYQYRWGLKIDVEQFFPSIDKEILKKLLRRKIKDKDLLWLLDEIIDGYPKEGIPIGTYTSQYFGNFYLSWFDHWIKEDLKVKVFHRYMDDMLFFADSKEKLWELLKVIKVYLWENLRLKVKGNYRVFPTFEVGADFVGYRSYGDKIILRNSTKNRMIKATNKAKKYGNVGEVAAYKGIVERTTGDGLYDNHIRWAEGVLFSVGKNKTQWI